VLTRLPRLKCCLQREPLRLPEARGVDLRTPILSGKGN
jgi:hypothetical protein